MKICISTVISGLKSVWIDSYLKSLAERTKCIDLIANTSGGVLERKYLHTKNFIWHWAVCMSLILRNWKPMHPFGKSPRKYPFIQNWVGRFLSRVRSSNVIPLQLQHRVKLRPNFNIASSLSSSFSYSRSFNFYIKSSLVSTSMSYEPSFSFVEELTI